jgi:hypothetical protein
VIVQLFGVLPFVCDGARLSRMATKKKSKKRSSKSKRTLRTTATAPKTVKRPKNSPKKKFALQPAQKKKASGKSKKSTGQKTRRGSTRPFSPGGPASRSGEQSGDLQGLSRFATADSESVNELLEEGNAFEADAVLGVENAGDEEKEVHTHEVPEDDVPEEYLDEK